MPKLPLMFFLLVSLSSPSWGWVGAGEQTFLGLIHKGESQKNKIYRIVECRQGLEMAQGLGNAFQGGLDPNPESFGCHHLSSELTHSQVQRLSKALAAPHEYINGACASISLALGFAVAAALGESGTLVQDIPSFLGVLTPAAMSLFPALEQTWLRVKRPDLGYQIDLADEWQQGGHDNCSLYLEFDDYKVLKQTVVDMVENM